MKRVCFDIDSNYFHRYDAPWLNEPAEAREYFRGRSFTFHAATAFDSTNQLYSDFTDYKKLFACLVEADEIITFNGRICDLIVLERLVGEEDAKKLWRKQHHDLAGWRSRFSLKGAIAEFLSGQEPSFETVRVERLAKICNSYDNDFIAEKLAGTYRDVRFTYALFQRYTASGDSDRTFRDIDS